MIIQCPVCRKERDILYPDLWAYKRSGTYYCSYGCKRKTEEEPEKMTDERQERLNTLLAKIRDGKTVRDALAEMGYTGRKAGQTYRYIRAYALEADPEGAILLPERIGGEPEVKSKKTREEPKITKPVNYDGYEVTGLKTEYGRFQLSNNGYLFFGANDHDELEMPVEIWREFAADLPRIMGILGIDPEI